MKNIETALGYSLEKNADGSVFLQKTELNRLNTRLAGNGEQVISSSKAKHLQKTLQERATRIAHLERQINTIASSLLTKKEWERFKGKIDQVPTQSL